MKRLSHFSLIGLCLTAAAAHADIYQWEYINPADPGQGKRQSTALAPDGAGVDAVPGVNLSLLNLQLAYLRGVDLSNAHGHSITFADADLTNTNLRTVSFENSNFVRADFTGADVRGAFLGLTN